MVERRGCSLEAYYHYNTFNYLVVLSAAGNSPLCFRIQAKVNRVTVLSRGMLTTSLVSQSKQVNTNRVIKSW